MSTQFSAKRTLPNGRVLYARDYGYKAWPFGCRRKKKAAKRNA